MGLSIQKKNLDEQDLKHFYLSLSLPYKSYFREGPFIYSNKVFTCKGQCIAPSETLIGFGGEADKKALHELRFHADAIIWGGKTIRKNDAHPFMKRTIVRERKKYGKRPFPFFCVVTYSGNLEGMSENTIKGLFREKYPPIIFVTEKNYENAKKFVVERGYKDYSKIIPVSEIEEGKLNLEEIINWLEGEGANRILVEAGPNLFISFLEQCLMDEIFRTITNKYFDEEGKLCKLPESEIPNDLPLERIVHNMPVKIEKISEIVAKNDDGYELLLRFRILSWCNF